jgi:hypothetical protein
MVCIVWLLICLASPTKCFAQFDYWFWELTICVHLRNIDQAQGLIIDFGSWWSVCTFETEPSTRFVPRICLFSGSLVTEPLLLLTFLLHGRWRNTISSSWEVRQHQEAAVCGVCGTSQERRSCVYMLRMNHLPTSPVFLLVIFHCSLHVV